MGFLAESACAASGLLSASISEGGRVGSWDSHHYLDCAWFGCRTWRQREKDGERVWRVGRGVVTVPHLDEGTQGRECPCAGWTGIGSVGLCYPSDEDCSRMGSSLRAYGM